MNKTILATCFALLIAAGLWSASWGHPPAAFPTFPYSVACSVDGKTVYLVVRYEDPGSGADYGRLLKSIKGASSWVVLPGK